MSKLRNFFVYLCLCYWPGLADAQFTDFLRFDITEGIPKEVLQALGGFFPDGIVGEPQIGGPGVLDPDNLPIGVGCPDATEMVLREGSECSESVSGLDDLQPEQR